MNISSQISGIPLWSINSPAEKITEKKELQTVTTPQAPVNPEEQKVYDEVQRNNLLSNVTNSSEATNNTKQISIESLLDICSDKKAVMFGEWHETGTVDYFTKEILPGLIDKGFKSIVLEALPPDFHGPVWESERMAILNNGEISQENTPKLWEHLNYTKEKDSVINLIKYCAQNNIELYGGGIPAEKLEKLFSIPMLPPDTLPKLIKQNLEQITQILPKNTKTIFYTGEFHNNYDDKWNVGVRETVNDIFGEDNVVSIDLINPNSSAREEPEYINYIANYNPQNPVSIRSNESFDYLVITEHPNNIIAEEFFIYVNSILDFAKSQGFEVSEPDDYVFARIKDPSKKTENSIPLTNGQIGTISASQGKTTIILEKEYGGLIEYIENITNIEDTLQLIIK